MILNTERTSRFRLEDLLDSNIGGLWGDEPGKGEVDVKVIRSTELAPNGGYDSSTAATRSLTAKQLEKRRLVAGDIVLEKSGGGPKTPVGRVALIRTETNPTVCSNFMVLLRPNKSLVLSSYLHQYLTYLHSTGKTIPLQTSSTNIRNMAMPDYMNVQVPVPTLDKQQEIITALHDSLARLDQVERDLDRLEINNKAFHASLLYSAVTGAFSPSSVEFTDYTLGDVATWGSGGTPKSGKKEYYGGPIPWCVIGDLTETQVFKTHQSITDLGLAESSAKIVPIGTVFLAMYGASIGRTGVAGVEMATNQAIACGKPKSELIDTDYMLMYLQSQKQKFNEAGKGGAQPNISQTIVKSWPIPLPNLDEQRRLVAFVREKLATAQQLKNFESESRTNLNNLRRSLMHLLFNGTPSDGALDE